MPMTDAEYKKYRNKIKQELKQEEDERTKKIIIEELNRTDNMDASPKDIKKNTGKKSSLNYYCKKFNLGQLYGDWKKRRKIHKSEQLKNRKMLTQERKKQGTDHQYALDRYKKIKSLLMKNEYVDVADLRWYYGFKRSHSYRDENFIKNLRMTNVFRKVAHFNG